jgi:hypothetical protein
VSSAPSRHQRPPRPFHAPVPRPSRPPPRTPAAPLEPQAQRSLIWSWKAFQAANLPTGTGTAPRCRGWPEIGALRNRSQLAWCPNGNSRLTLSGKIEPCVASENRDVPPRGHRGAGQHGY